MVVRYLYSVHAPRRISSKSHCHAGPLPHFLTDLSHCSPVSLSHSLCRGLTLPHSLTISHFPFFSLLSYVPLSLYLTGPLLHCSTVSLPFCLIGHCLAAPLSYCLIPSLNNRSLSHNCLPLFYGLIIPTAFLSQLTRRPNCFVLTSSPSRLPRRPDCLAVPTAAPSRQPRRPDCRAVPTASPLRLLHFPNCLAATTALPFPCLAVPTASTSRPECLAVPAASPSQLVPEEIKMARTAGHFKRLYKSHRSSLPRQ